jgi:hypothetical protein
MEKSQHSLNLTANQRVTVKIITRKIGMAPKLELQESNHPLYFEQQSGIDMNRVMDFAKKKYINH